ncbi:MAG TPA: hypothetical protein P5340_13205, partial [Defluviicoccus sp.]|nr:hypothetical protein [Defluviicoccus sp.]
MFAAQCQSARGKFFSVALDLSHEGMAGTEVNMMTGQESRAVRCGASGKRHDTDCHHVHPALRVALARPPAASGSSTVGHRYAFR